MLKKCNVCGLILEEELIGDQCPKCHAEASRFQAVDQTESEKLIRSHLTNTLLSELVVLAQRQVHLAEKGIADQLDPGCVRTFELALQQAVALRQAVRAEIAGHVRKEKW